MGIDDLHEDGGPEGLRTLAEIERDRHNLGCAKLLESAADELERRRVETESLADQVHEARGERAKQQARANAISNAKGQVEGQLADIATELSYAKGLLNYIVNVDDQGMTVGEKVEYVQDEVEEVLGR